MRIFPLACLALLAACGPSTPTPATTTTSAAAPAPSAAPSATPTPSRATDTFPTAKGDLRVTPIFHASVLLEVAGQAVYVDPFGKGDFTGLPKADFVLVTDVHFDHLDPKAIDAIAKPTTRVVAPKAAAKELEGRANVTLLDNGQKISVGLFDVEAVPMYNLERGPEKGKKFHDKGRGNGYVLTFGDKRLYFSGDTECTPEMKALPAIDVAFVCMNLPYTMPPKEAAGCIEAFKPKVLFPYHYAVPGGPPGSSSNLDELGDLKKAGVEVRARRWYGP